MIDNWIDLLAAAKPLVGFLSQGDFFARGYHGTTNRRLVLEDASVARRYATDDSFDSFDEWQTVSDDPRVFPDSFEWKRWIDHNLRKNNYFDIASKDFNGADAKWMVDGSSQLFELMHRDIRIFMNCYANEFFPPIWLDMLDVYLNDGFPCGWSGRRPDGELVVFSNGPPNRT
jgi:hypothetical protein